jgi:hypothetical protein
VLARVGAGLAALSLVQFAASTHGCLQGCKCELLVSAILGCSLIGLFALTRNRVLHSNGVLHSNRVLVFSLSSIYRMVVVWRFPHIAGQLAHGPELTELEHVLVQPGGGGGGRAAFSASCSHTSPFRGYVFEVGFDPAPPIFIFFKHIPPKTYP